MIKFAQINLFGRKVTKKFSYVQIKCTFYALKHKKNAYTRRYMRFFLKIGYLKFVTNAKSDTSGI